jgi:protein tyrosine phosphatase
MDTPSNNPKATSTTEGQTSPNFKETKNSSTNDKSNENSNNKVSKLLKRAIGDDIYDLPEHVRLLFEPISSTSTLDGFDIEFKYVEKMSAELEKTQTYSHANKPNNQMKNRYYNVLPPDKSRVKLSQLEGDEDSDYINANFADVCDIEYICTQGPLDTTIIDFWRMIWEYKSYVILMLTQEIEQDREKCSRYWPERDADTYGDFQIILLSKEVATSDIIVRRFRLTKRGSNEEREIVHFQWISWPDYGSPKSTSDFLTLVSMVDAANIHRAPITVHCSAGIGRSGTFCCVHAIVNMMNEYVKKHNKMPPINIVRTILKLREYRPGIVQSKEQYIFVYLAILEHWNILSAQLNQKSQKTIDKTQMK